MGKLVCGIGINDGKRVASIEGKSVKEYTLWQDMLLRCTAKYWNKCPSYNGVSCSENFKVFSYFYDWCNRQAGFKNKDSNNKSWQLDKDVLVKSNKVYSEDVCVFIPQQINTLLVKRNASRGDYPLGVHWSVAASKYSASCSIGEGSQHLGCFQTQEEAFQVYKTFKEAYIKQVANEYRTQLDPRAYQALLNYTVEITD